MAAIDFPSWILQTAQEWTSPDSFSRWKSTFNKAVA